MRGCERAVSLNRARPPRGPCTLAARSPPRGPCTLAARSPPRGHCTLAATTPPTTCGGDRPSKQCIQHTLLRSHAGEAISHAYCGTRTPLTRRRRRSYAQAMLPPNESVLLRHTVVPPTQCTETILPQTNHEVLLLRNDQILSRHYNKVIENDEKCIEEAKLSQSAIEKVTLSQRCSEEVKFSHGSVVRLSSAAADKVLKTRGPARVVGAFLLCLLLLASIRGGALAGGLGTGAVCARAPGLTERQRALCRAAPAAMPAIAAGLRAAFAECRAQLAGRRWNCSGVGDHNLFGHVVPLATREAAFTYALASAGVTHALSAACARGDLPACGCAHRRRAGNAQWEWGAGGAGGAGDARCGDAAYGARLARRFLDARELERDARALMNLHNNRLGRKMVKELVRVECKCHGVSGSCSVRTCWRALPPLARVARALRDKYARARLVAATGTGALGVRRARGPPRPARRADLVYLAPSPAYCEPEPAADAPGTHGRRCNRTSSGEDGCAALCCGRGHFTQRTTQRVQCRCSFHWCCRVSCDTCLVQTDLHICN